MTEPAKGVLAMIAACMIWGLSPIYYKILADIPPLEVLSHRTIWSAVFFGIVLMVQGRLVEMPGLLRGRAVLLTGLAALAISANWFLFIYSVQSGHTLEASLGYYIFPLVAVLIGVLAFGERLSALHGVAVLLAGVAAGVLTWGLGAAPWISLALAISFGLYGLMKKRNPAGPVLSVAAEVTILCPLAAIWLGGLHSGLWAEGVRPGAVFGENARETLLLIFSGVLTGTPLVLFSYASRRVRMATVGLIQYINPTLQFLCATVIFAEPFTGWHMIAFPMIWAALVIYSMESLRQDRASRRASSSVLTSATSRM